MIAIFISYAVRATGSQLTTEANIIRCHARRRELHLLRGGAAAAGDDDKDEDAVAKVGLSEAKRQKETRIKLCATRRHS